MAGYQRRDQRQQGVEVGGQIDVHIGQHRRLGVPPHGAQRPAAPLLLQPYGGDLVDRLVEPGGDLRGAVGARVVGDGDAEAVGEGPGEVVVKPPDTGFEVGLLVVDGDDDVEDRVGVAGAQVLAGREGAQGAGWVGPRWVGRRRAAPGWPGRRWRS